MISFSASLPARVQLGFGGSGRTIRAGLKLGQHLLDLIVVGTENLEHIRHLLLPP